MRTRLFFAACLLVVALTAVLTLVEDAPRRSGTNNVLPAAEVVRLDAGREACQSEDIPPATRAVQLWTQPGPGIGSPAVAVRVREPGGPVVNGRAGTPGRAGLLRAELTRSPTPGPAQLCIVNRGARRLAILGVVTADPADARGLLRRSRPAGTMAVDYYRAGSETWMQMAPTVADRFGLGKSGLLGAWTLWLVLAAVLGAWVCAVLALGRRETSS